MGESWPRSTLEARDRDPAATSDDPAGAAWERLSEHVILVQLHDEGWLYHLFRHEMPVAGAIPASLPPPRMLNYVYNNGFRISDYRTTADLCLRVRPDLMLYGHWAPGLVTDDDLAELKRHGIELERLHRELLPDDKLHLADDGPLALIVPYQQQVEPGAPFDVIVEVRNPSPTPTQVHVALATPERWKVEPRRASAVLNGDGPRELRFTVCLPRGTSGRRQRIAADVTVDGIRLGQVAEALVSVG